MRLIVAVFVVLPFLVLAQDKVSKSRLTPEVSQYLTSFGKVEGKAIASNKKLEDFIGKVSAKESGLTSRAFLNKVFFKTHAKFLKSFKEYATFTEIFTDGDYNCLTATALYSLILEQLNFEYKVVETNYHIFIIAKTTDGDVLLETTDPLNGFISGQKEIAARIAKYMVNSSGEQLSNKLYYQFNVALYNPIDVMNIPGLLHYNLAVDHYNQEKLIPAIDHLEKAQTYYTSQRLEEFSKIVLLTVVESNLQELEKLQLVRRLQHIRQNQANTTVAMAH